MSKAVSGAGISKLRDSEIHWVDGGPLSGWSVVHSRAGRPVGGTGHPARFMFTRAMSLTVDPVIQRWVDHVGMLIDGDAWQLDQKVFCRIVVRQRSIAINATPFDDVASAQESMRSFAARTEDLEVAFAFLPAEPIPMWVIRGHTGPQFVGLPQHHLARVSDPRSSLAALLSAARAKGQVHEVGGERAKLESIGRNGAIARGIPQARRA